MRPRLAASTNDTVSTPLSDDSSSDKRVIWICVYFITPPSVAKKKTPRPIISSSLSGPAGRPLQGKALGGIDYVAIRLMVW
jgi:hypothetical protein